MRRTSTNPNPPREERSASSVATRSSTAASNAVLNASAPFQNTPVIPPPIQELVIDQEDEEIELNFSDLRLFNIHLPATRWCNEYVSDTINCVNKLKRKELTVTKLEKHMEEGTFPPDLKFKFSGYAQYPSTISRESIEAVHAQELELIIKVQRIY